jgi:hypothetical protein
MSYCHATSDNARYLASKTGLNVFVALAWLWNECQAVNNPTNPLNIRYYGTHGQIGKGGGQNAGFGVYQDAHGGLDHAAWLINNSANYTGIRSAIKTGNIWAEARAIELSPWAGGHYGGASGPGNISKKLSSITGKPIEQVAQSADQTIASGDSYGEGKATGATDGGMLGGFGNLVSFPVGHIITAADVQQIMDVTTKAGWWDQIGGQTAKEIMQGILQQEIGKPWNKDTQIEIQSKVNMAAGLSGQIGPNAIAAAASVVPDVAGAIGGFGNTIIKAVTYVLATVLILVGIWLYSKGRTPTLIEEGVSGG